MNVPADLPFGLPLPATPPRDEFDARMSQDPLGPRRIEVGIEMRDGVELAADVYLPAASQLPAPAIVVGTPYDKSGPFEELAAYQDAGYIGVYFDTRGRGKSEGVFQPRSLQDGADGHDVVEWVAAQEWCDGSVGMTGISYMGWMTMVTIAHRPPHLKAAVPISSTGRFQEELPYTHGCFWLYMAGWFELCRRRIMNFEDPDPRRQVSELIQILPVEAIGDVLEPAGEGLREMLEHDTLDEVWRSRRWDGEYDFDVPCLHVTGWHDRENIWGTLHHYQEMLACSPAREQQWLLVGPWPHISCRYPSSSYAGVETPGAALDMTAIQLRFFDRFLRGQDNGVDDEPRVRLYDPGANEWRVRPSWQGDTEERQIFLSEAGGLNAEAGTKGEESYTYDPMQPSGVPRDDDGHGEYPLDLAGLESQPGVVVWTSPPLEEGMTVRGWGEVELYAATDREDTDWHVKLADVEPNGRSLWVASGCLRASYGEDPTAPAAVPPGVPRRYSIELTPIFHTFSPGHRVRLVLASSEFPWFARNLNRFEPIARQSEPLVATNTVFFGESHPSCLRLRVEP